jgi:hypothetical protein
LAGFGAAAVAAPIPTTAVVAIAATAPTVIVALRCI